MVIIGRSILLTAANGFLSISVNPKPLPCARDKYGFEIPASLDKWTEILFVFLALGRREIQAVEADSPSEIVLGTSTALTGSAQNPCKNVQRGIVAGFGLGNR